MDSRHRRIALENLNSAFGDEKSQEQINAVAEQTFKNIAYIPFEMGWSLRLNEKKIKSYFTIYGGARLMEYAGKGRGVFLLTAHMGNWELLPIAGKMMKCPISIIYRPLDFQPLNAFIENLRTRFGAKLIPKANSMRKILRAQRNGDAVATLMDQSADWYDGVITDFFNRRAFTSKGLALLVSKTKAPVIPLFIAREGRGYRVEFGDPLSLVQSPDKTREIEENTQIFTDCIEAFIRRYPDQWFWVHRRWKNKSFRPWPREE